LPENKTTRNKASVKEFLAGVPDGQMRLDSQVLLKLMQEASGEKPQMWGTSIVGFGSYHYKYPSGHEGDAPVVSFSPRKQSLTVYILARLERFQAVLKDLGTFKTGVGCLYIKRLDDVHLPTLKKLIRLGVKVVRTEGYGTQP
jgi:hypothetical protein